MVSTQPIIISHFMIVEKLRSQSNIIDTVMLQCTACSLQQPDPIYTLIIYNVIIMTHSIIITSYRQATSVSLDLRPCIFGCRVKTCYTVRTAGPGPREVVSNPVHQSDQLFTVPQ